MVVLETLAEKAAAQVSEGLSRSLVRGALSKSPTLRETYALWLVDLEASEAARKTVHDYKTSVSKFLEWADSKGILLVHEVTRRHAGDYVSDKLQAMAKDTRNRNLSGISNWWKWLIQKGRTKDDQANPWGGQRGAVTKSRGGKKAKGWVPYTTEEISNLLRTLEGPLADLFRLGLFTGGRINELASLRAKHVVEKHGVRFLSIEEGKTEAAIRHIPIHPQIETLVDRLLRTAEADPGGWFFPDSVFPPGGYDKDKGHSASKKFSAARRGAGVDRAGVVFHSTRKNLIELLEGAEVPLSTVQLLVGHERRDMTFGRYSKGVCVNLSSAIQKVDYGPEVNALV